MTSCKRRKSGPRVKSGPNKGKYYCRKRRSKSRSKSRSRRRTSIGLFSERQLKTLSPEMQKAIHNYFFTPGVIYSDRYDDLPDGYKEYLKTTLFKHNGWYYPRFELSDLVPVSYFGQETDENILDFPYVDIPPHQRYFDDLDSILENFMLDNGWNIHVTDYGNWFLHYKDFIKLWNTVSRITKEVPSYYTAIEEVPDEKVREDLYRLNRIILGT